MLHIYYGMGKGKTSTLNGSAIRAKASGMNVIIFRFLKGRQSSEDALLQQNDITIYKTQTDEKFVIQMNEEEKAKTKKELLLSIKDLKNFHKEFDLIILDEFLDLIVDNVSLMNEEEMTSLLKELKESGNEIMISGHQKNEKIFELADLITHFDPEKHYYEKGIKARKGIEY